MNIICWASRVVYSTESGEIGIRVCFCSDMDEEPQSTDQSTDRMEGGRGSHEGRGEGGGKEGARRGRALERYRSGPGSCSPVSCHR